MKRFFLTCLFIGLTSFAISATRNVYVDYANEDAFEVSLASGSTDTLVFNVLNNGASMSLDSYTPVLYLSRTPTFDPDNTVSTNGTATATTASFVVTDLNISAGKNGYFMQVAFRSGLGTIASPYVYNYPINGKLKVDGTPVSTSGNPFTAMNTKTFSTGGTLAIGVGTGASSGTVSSAIQKIGDIYTTTVYVDLTGLNSSAAGDVIGNNGESNAYIFAYDTAESGTAFAGQVTCLEAPATGEPDIDIYCASLGTRAEDETISGMSDEVALLDAGADWAVTAAVNPRPLTGLPGDGKYIYLVGSGGGTDQKYTAGILKIEIYGK